VDHYAEEGFALGLGDVVAEDSEPGVLGALFVGVDGDELLVFLAGFDVERLEFVVGAWG
jgi:hypothetical protein